MTLIEQIEEERFVESLICLWIQPDAPKWIVDYVRQELKKQRGLLEEKADGIYGTEHAVEPVLDKQTGRISKPIRCIACGKWECLEYDRENYEAVILGEAIGLCNSCREAIKWAKEQMEGR